jgi:hypothetical protein
MEYAPYPLPPASHRGFLEAAADLSALADARQLLEYLNLAEGAGG